MGKVNLRGSELQREHEGFKIHSICISLARGGPLPLLKRESAVKNEVSP